MTKFYSINEFCKLTLVSVRTLHYYDEIDLLKPSRRTHKGHRLYSESDMLCLQQIMMLKFMGMSLLKIKKLLQTEKFNLLESLKMQANALAEEKLRLKKISTFLNYLIHHHELHKAIDWESVVKILEVFKQKKITDQNWYKKYLSKAEFQQFKQFEKKRSKKWKALFEEIQKNINVDPESQLALKLVKKCMTLANEAYGNHPGLTKKIWEAYKAGIIPQNNFPHDKKVIAFLSRVFEKFKQ